MIGVVYDPLLDELYHALLGGGAHRNGRRISVSRESELRRALVSTGFAYDKAISEDDNTREFRAFLKQAREVRRDGSAALDLCYVAGGRFDAYWEFKLSPWDVLAGRGSLTPVGSRAACRRVKEYCPETDEAVLGHDLEPALDAFADQVVRVVTGLGQPRPPSP